MYKIYLLFFLCTCSFNPMELTTSKKFRRPFTFKKKIFSQDKIIVHTHDGSKIAIDKKTAFLSKTINDYFHKFPTKIKFKCSKVASKEAKKIINSLEYMIQEEKTVSQKTLHSTDNLSVLKWNVLKNFLIPDEKIKRKQKLIDALNFFDFPLLKKLLIINNLEYSSNRPLLVNLLMHYKDIWHKIVPLLQNDPLLENVTHAIIQNIPENNWIEIPEQDYYTFDRFDKRVWLKKNDNVAYKLGTQVPVNNIASFIDLTNKNQICEWSPDYTYFALWLESSTIFFYNTSSHELIDRLNLEQECFDNITGRPGKVIITDLNESRLSWSADGKYLAIIVTLSHRKYGAVLIYNCINWENTTLFNNQNNISQIAWAPHSYELTIGSNCDTKFYTMNCWNTSKEANLILTKKIDQNGKTNILWSPNGVYIALQSPDFIKNSVNDFRIWATQNKKANLSIFHNLVEPVLATLFFYDDQNDESKISEHEINWSSDSEFIIVISFDKVKIYRAPALQLIAQYPTPIFTNFSRYHCVIGSRLHMDQKQLLLGEYDLRADKIKFSNKNIEIFYTIFHYLTKKLSFSQIIVLKKIIGKKEGYCLNSYEKKIFKDLCDQEKFGAFIYNALRHINLVNKVNLKISG